MTREAGVTDDQDHLERSPYAYALRQRLERDAAAGQPFTGLTQQDYAHALESAYKGTPEWEKLREFIRALQDPDFDPLHNPVVPDSDDLREHNPARNLYITATTQAHFIAYARHHNLEPLTYTEAAREWAAANQQALEETSQPTDQEVREVYASGYRLAGEQDGPELTPAEIEERRSSVYELDLDARMRQILRANNLFSSEFVPSVELDPDTLQPAKSLRVLSMGHALADPSKTYGPLNAQAIWRVPPGVQPPVTFFQYVWERARAELLLEHRKTGNLAPELALPGILRTPTAPLFRHQAAHLLSTSATRQDTLEGIDRRPQEYRSRPGIPQYLDGLSPPETTLDRMSSTLLSQKKNGVALVKMHLQLMNLAYENNGMPFEYDLPENLPALGYKRQSHGGIDSKTLNESRIRLLTLTAQWIETWREDRRGRQREWETPYWIMEGRARDRDYDPDRMMNVLLRDPNPSQFTTVIIRPGAWWQLADMARLHLEIPAEILALPTDGGNATERLMVQLTLVLAGWVRSGQRQHKGKHWDYSIGTLLEAAHVITEQDFKKGSPDTARRLRDRLWSHPESGPIEGDGALPRLNNLGAFNIELLDQEAFWATGRGWRGPFWETKIRLRIPDLGIRSIERASQKKQQRARKK